MSSIKVLPRPDGLMRHRNTEVRKCPSCGKIVNKYHHARAKVTLCYACEDKKPWNWAYICE